MFLQQIDKNTFWLPLLDSLIEWIFIHAKVFKIFISRKKGYRENEETRNGDTKPRKVLLLAWRNSIKLDKKNLFVNS